MIWVAILGEMSTDILYVRFTRKEIIFEETLKPLCFRYLRELQKNDILYVVEGFTRVSRLKGYSGL